MDGWGEFVRQGTCMYASLLSILPSRYVAFITRLKRKDCGFFFFLFQEIEMGVLFG